MPFAICMVAAAPVRKEPSHRSEMVNQLLFGETMEILEVKEEWFRVRSLYDQYEGWLTCHLVQEVAEQLATAPEKFISTGLVNEIQAAGQVTRIPMGAPFTGFSESSKKLWDQRLLFGGQYRNVQLPFSMEVLHATVMSWINAPYLWGGKTFMGVDCSGFVQTVYRISGRKLPRDAWQQQQSGTAVSSNEHAAKGDLAFFQNEQGRIIHVGIVWENRHIIHVSGKVRIDTLDKEGIRNEELGKRSHLLHSIRRII